MKWVTRERPKTDRIACPWLIKNFIDPEAEFLYVPAEQVLEVAEREGAHSYDAKDAEYTHRDGLCSFEVLLEEYKLDDPALQLLARIVHGADIADDRDATPQSRGLLAVAEGFHLLDLGDHRQLELSLPVYDALYAWCKHRPAAARAAEMSLTKVGFVPIPPGARPGLDHARPRRRLSSFTLGQPLGENCTASIVDLDLQLGRGRPGGREVPALERAPEDRVWMPLTRQGTHVREDERDRRDPGGRHG